MSRKDSRRGTRIYFANPFIHSLKKVWALMCMKTGEKCRHVLSFCGQYIKTVNYTVI